MSKTFSLILPTRQRLPGLKRLLDSLVETTFNLDDIEVFLVMDQDDTTMEQAFELTNQYAMSIYIMAVKQSDHFNRDYMNFAASKCHGKNLWMLNDDAVIETKWWDSIIKIAVGGRQVYMVDTWCTDHEELHSFPRFPMVSRLAMEAVGFVFYPQIRMWGADAVLFDLYKKAGCVVECHQVKVAHEHMPSKRFYDMYAEDVKNKVFPIGGLEELNKLKKAKETYGPGQH